MKRPFAQAGWISLLAAGLAGLVPAPAAVALEPVAVYESWRGSSTLNSHRWLVREDGQNQEIALGIQGHRLHMRHRREGGGASNAGATTGVQALLAQNPLSIERIEVDLQVHNLEVSGCAANPGTTVVRPARLALATFNDGGVGVGQIGDHVILILVSAPADALEAGSVLTVEGDLARCVTADCGATVSIASAGTVTVPVSKPFTLRAAWDRANHQVFIGVSDHPDVALRYDAALDAARARVPFAALRTAVTTANCTAAPTVADVELAVREVRTNVSAIIPDR
ncbi:MAG TPA: hypothetical protein VJY35_13175 [Candidatus Eisenbacteria bacterium]|nr:hypothetical protein [Candidatus Eisenbacteria bacterium]